MHKSVLQGECAVAYIPLASVVIRNCKTTVITNRYDTTSFMRWFRCPTNQMVRVGWRMMIISFAEFERVDFHIPIKRWSAMVDDRPTRHYRTAGHPPGSRSRMWTMVTILWIDLAAWIAYIVWWLLCWKNLHSAIQTCGCTCDVVIDVMDGCQD